MILPNLTLCQENTIERIFKITFVLLGLIAAIMVIGNSSLLQFIKIGGITNMFDYMINAISNNFMVFSITTGILLIIAYSLIFRYNHTLYNYITRNSQCAESFINGIKKDKVLCALTKFKENNEIIEDMKRKYPERMRHIGGDEKIDSIQKVIANIIEKLNKTDIDELDPYSLYELLEPLLNEYYLMEKDASDLEIDLGIPIIVPNRKLEDEYRTRFSKVHYVKDYELYPQLFTSGGIYEPNRSLSEAYQTIRN